MAARDGHLQFLNSLPVKYDAYGSMMETLGLDEIVHDKKADGVFQAPQSLKL